MLLLLKPFAYVLIAAAALFFGFWLLLFVIFQILPRVVLGLGIAMLLEYLLPDIYVHLAGSMQDIFSILAPWLHIGVNPVVVRDLFALALGLSFSGKGIGLLMLELKRVLANNLTPVGSNNS